MPLQNHSKLCILKITLTILGETHSQIEHFVTVVFGRNSFTCQRSWSTDKKLVYTLEKHGFWILTMHLFKIPSQIEHFVNVVLGKNSFTCQRTW